jgi:hypothetical protein
MMLLGNHRRPLVRWFAACAVTAVAVGPGGMSAVSAERSHDPMSPAFGVPDIDAATMVESVNGRSTVAAGLAAGDWLGQPETKTGPRGFFFGKGEAAGPRHVRIGFTRQIPLGTVVTRGQGRLSVLRPEAEFPGDPAREGDWLAADCLRPAQISVWVLPPGTRTRAIRWTAEGQPAASACPELWNDGDLPDGLVGWCGGLYAFGDRFIDVAPYAEVVPLTPGPDPERITDSEYRLWKGFGGLQRLWQVWETDKEAWQATDDKPPLAIVFAWRKPVSLVAAGVCLPGFSRARLDAYTGSADSNPREAVDDAWTSRFEGAVRSRYPAGFDIEWLAVESATKTRAVRLVGLAPPVREQVAPELAAMLRGRRSWLGDSIMLAALGDRSPADVARELENDKPHPPIPIRLTLEAPGFVTLVIEDAAGNRVRNLISETPFPAGEHTVWWDGLDDHRAKNKKPHGAYEVDGRLVEEGEYRVRGLVRGQIDLRYEFTVYNPVDPPWRTADRRGQWLSDHKPPGDVLFVPGKKPFMLIGSRVAEGGHGLVWTDLDGNKIAGLTALGAWAGAAALAYDVGPRRNPADEAYAAAVWGDALYLRAIRGQSAQPVLRPDITLPPRDAKGGRPRLGNEAIHGGDNLAGLAAFNQTLVVSSPRLGGLMVVDAANGRVAGTIPLEQPRGVAFAADGTLVCATARGVVRFPAFTAAALPAASAAVPVVTAGLDDPHGVAVDGKGTIYVSDRGRSHQVKVFSSAGTLLRTIGKAGVPGTGPYDELQMHNPAGITVTDSGDVWVAEEDFRPKRVSVWWADGKLRFAKYGPSRYGGGGTIDPLDKSRFFLEGMEFRLDWKTGTDRLVSVYHRPDPAAGLILGNEAFGALKSPETPIHLGGRQYMLNVYDENPTGGPRVAGVWLMRDGRAELVAAVGLVNEWPALHTSGIAKHTSEGKGPVSFAWSDLDVDGAIDPDEVTFAPGDIGRLNVTRDLSFVSALTFVVTPARFTPEGVPVYDITSARRLLPDARVSKTSGGDQVTLGKNGDLSLMMPFERSPAPAGFAGVTATGGRWFYPDKWHGLHASQTARPGRIPEPGELIGTTRTLGLPVTPRGSDAGEIWGINANSGVIYLFTTDGLFVATLFKNGWIAAHQGPKAVRGMLLNEASTEGESFYPTITQTTDGQIYLTAVEHTSSIVHVEGLESIRRLPATTVAVTPELLAACRDYETSAEVARLARQGRDELLVRLVGDGGGWRIDGDLAEWSEADWVPIDGDTRAALAVVGERLVVAYHTTTPNLLENAGSEPWYGLFKTGGGVDLMLATRRLDGKATAAAAEGDLRLIVARVAGKHRALLYRPVVPGTAAADRIPFSSPQRTVFFDVVTDVSKDVALAASGRPNVRPPWAAANERTVRPGTGIEFSIPLRTLGLVASPGTVIPGDVGILKGDGSRTTFRACWHNHATALTQDVPGEAMLTPALWGRFRFQP